jgi:hypothetical protein
MADDLTSSIDPLRREIAAHVVRLVGIAFAVPVAVVSTCVAAKAAKSDFMYQEHRRAGKGCGDCKFFTPDRANGDVGSCSIVEGSVQRDGWCLAFAPSPSK